MKHFFIIVLGFFLFLPGCADRDGKERHVAEIKQSEINQPVDDEQQLKRYCLTLDLKDNPKLIEEYKYWHQKEHIWPEIPKGIREVGIKDMEIYLLGTRLFMIMDVPEDFDFDRQMAKLAELPRQKEWEAFVSKFQRSAPGAKSSEKWKMMEKIFELP